MPSLLLMVSCQLELFCHNAHAELLCSLCSLEEEGEEVAGTLLVVGCCFVVGRAPESSPPPNAGLCQALLLHPLLALSAAKASASAGCSRPLTSLSCSQRCWLCWRLCCWLCWCCWLLLLSSLPPSCFASCPPWRSRGAALALEVCFFRALQPAKE